MTGLVALIVLGPKRLPEVARTAGKWVGRMRRFVDGVKQDINRELQAEELAHLKKLQEDLYETRNLFENSAHVLLEDPAKSIDAPIAEPTKTEPAKEQTQTQAATVADHTAIGAQTQPKVARKKKSSAKLTPSKAIISKSVVAKPAPRKKRDTTPGQS